MGMGAQIRQLRKEKGLSQAQLGNMVGAEANTVSRWEKDKIEASHDYIIKLADALDTTADYLLGRTKSSERTQSAPKERSVQEDRGILSYTFSNGERLEVPATQEGYAFLREAINNRNQGNGGT